MYSCERVRNPGAALISTSIGRQAWKPESGSAQELRTPVSPDIADSATTRACTRG